MKNIFNSNIIPACEYCAYGRMSPSKDKVLCIKRGFMLPSSSCHSFKYDVLKRKPKKSPKIDTNYTKEDFSL